MPKILFINTVSGFSSTGRITGELASMDGYESLICFGRKKDYLNQNAFKFAQLSDNCVAAAKTILLDDNLHLCKNATKKLIRKIQDFDPDIIHLHNLHGYYLDVEGLFLFLKQYHKPVVWTLHDCWSFTGYCPHFDMIQCDKYKTECTDCPHGFSYPFSIFKQRVKREFYEKKDLFNSLDNLTIVTPSVWLRDRVQESFLKDHSIVVIYNGINIPDFSIEKKNSFSILAVSSYWTKEKGIDELKKIIPLIDDDIEITIVGNRSDKSEVFKRCNMIDRTDDYDELLKLYSEASLFINPTVEEVFGLVNVEAQSCGTPVLTYRTGGSPESVTEKTGIVIDKYDHKAFAEAINRIKRHNPFDSNEIRKNAQRFDKKIMLEKYDALYKEMLK